MQVRFSARLTQKGLERADAFMPVTRKDTKTVRDENRHTRQVHRLPVHA